MAKWMDKMNPQTLDWLIKEKLFKLIGQVSNAEGYFCRQKSDPNLDQPKARQCKPG
jgi:hypothetical protein